MNVPMPIPKEWLRHSATVDLLEQEYMYEGRPFGNENDTWETLKRKMSAGDTLWFFQSPPETWTGIPRSGFEGIALMRGDEVVDVLLTAIS